MKCLGKVFLEIGGQKIAYLERGRGAPVVFLHGLLDNRKLWDKVFHALPLSFFRRFQAITLNFPPYDGEFNLKTLPAILRKLFGQLDVPEVILAGYSLGSLVSLRFASLYPKQVKRLILISAPIATNVRAQALCRLRTRLKKGERIDKIEKILKGHPRLTKKIVGPTGFNYKLLTRGDVLGPLSACLNDLCDYDWQNGIKNITCPTLCLYGKKDIFLSLLGSRKLYPTITSVSIAAVEGNHFLPTGKAKEVASFIFDFLRDNDPG